MPAFSTEDTIIQARPKRAGSLFADAKTDTSNQTVFEQCRKVFRELGERICSTDLSRKIYG